MPIIMSSASLAPKIPVICAVLGVHGILLSGTLSEVGDAPFFSSCSFLAILVLTVFNFLAASLSDPGFVGPDEGASQAAHEDRGLLLRPLEQPPPQLVASGRTFAATSPASAVSDHCGQNVIADPTAPHFHEDRRCNACNVHIPLRAKHCRDCDRCVRTHDHHCPWIANCVGEGNRVFFFGFVFFQLLEAAVCLLMLIAGGAVKTGPPSKEQVAQQSAAAYANGSSTSPVPIHASSGIQGDAMDPPYDHGQHVGFMASSRPEKSRQFTSATAIFTLIGLAFVVVALAALVITHVFLISVNQTTWEMVLSRK